MPSAPQTVEQLDELASRPDAGVLDILRSVEGPVLVAGAGGKMGYHLCLMLKRGFEKLEQSNEVIAVSRFGSPGSTKAFEDNSITTLSADLTNPDIVKSLPDATSVFYLAGRKFGTSDSPEILRLFNEEMPAFVAERFSESRIVALSTGCVYPFVTPESGGSREADPVGPSGDYAVSCLGRENAFTESSRNNETPLSLIRLNYAVDLRYGVLVDVATRVFACEPIDLTMGYLNCIWQGDAIRHTIQSLDHASPAPSPFLLNVTGSRILSVREIASRLADHFGKDVSFTGEEAPTAWLNNAEKSHHLFGEPEIDESTLIEWVADWIKKGGPLLGKPTHFEVRDGKY